LGWGTSLTTIGLPTASITIAFILCVTSLFDFRSGP
jgi:hypothetical protein